MSRNPKKTTNQNLIDTSETVKPVALNYWRNARKQKTPIHRPPSQKGNTRAAKTSFENEIKRQQATVTSASDHHILQRSSNFQYTRGQFERSTLNLNTILPNSRHSAQTLHSDPYRAGSTYVEQCNPALALYPGIMGTQDDTLIATRIKPATRTSYSTIWEPNQDNTDEKSHPQDIDLYYPVYRGSGSVQQHTSFDDSYCAWVALTYTSPRVSSAEVYTQEHVTPKSKHLSKSQKTDSPALDLAVHFSPLCFVQPVNYAATPSKEIFWAQLRPYDPSKNPDDNASLEINKNSSVLLEALSASEEWESKAETTNQDHHSKPLRRAITIDIDDDEDEKSSEKIIIQKKQQHLPHHKNQTELKEEQEFEESFNSAPRSKDSRRSERRLHLTLDDEQQFSPVRINNDNEQKYSLLTPQPQLDFVSTHTFTFDEENKTSTGLKRHTNRQKTLSLVSPLSSKMYSQQVETVETTSGPLYESIFLYKTFTTSHQPQWVPPLLYSQLFGWVLLLIAFTLDVKGTYQQIAESNYPDSDTYGLFMYGQQYFQGNLLWICVFIFIFQTLYARFQNRTTEDFSEFQNFFVRIQEWDEECIDPNFKKLHQALLNPNTPQQCQLAYQQLTQLIRYLICEEKWQAMHYLLLAIHKQYGECFFNDSFDYKIKLQFDNASDQKKQECSDYTRDVRFNQGNSKISGNKPLLALQIISYAAQWQDHDIAIKQQRNLVKARREIRRKTLADYTAFPKNRAEAIALSLGIITCLKPRFLENFDSNWQYFLHCEPHNTQAFTNLSWEQQINIFYTLMLSGYVQMFLTALSLLQDRNHMPSCYAPTCLTSRSMFTHIAVPATRTWKQKIADRISLGKFQDTNFEKFLLYYFEKIKPLDEPTFRSHLYWLTQPYYAGLYEVFDANPSLASDILIEYLKILTPDLRTEESERNPDIENSQIEQDNDQKEIEAEESLIYPDHAARLFWSIPRNLTRHRVLGLVQQEPTTRLFYVAQLFRLECSDDIRLKMFACTQEFGVMLLKPYLQKATAELRKPAIDFFWDTRLDNNRRWNLLWDLSRESDHWKFLFFDRNIEQDLSELKNSAADANQDRELKRVIQEIPILSEVPKPMRGLALCLKNVLELDDHGVKLFSAIEKAPELIPIVMYAFGRIFGHDPSTPKLGHALIKLLETYYPTYLQRHPELNKEPHLKSGYFRILHLFRAVCFGHFLQKSQLQSLRYLLQGYIQLPAFRKQKSSSESKQDIMLDDELEMQHQKMYDLQNVVAELDPNKWLNRTDLTKNIIRIVTDICTGEKDDDKTHTSLAFAFICPVICSPDFILVAIEAFAALANESNIMNNTHLPKKKIILFQFLHFIFEQKSSLQSPEFLAHFESMVERINSNPSISDASGNKSSIYTTIDHLQEYLQKNGVEPHKKKELQNTVLAVHFYYLFRHRNLHLITLGHFNLFSVSTPFDDRKKAAFLTDLQSSFDHQFRPGCNPKKLSELKDLYEKQIRPILEKLEFIYLPEMDYVMREMQTYLRGKASQRTLPPRGRYYGSNSTSEPLLDDHKDSVSNHDNDDDLSLIPDM